VFAVVSNESDRCLSVVYGRDATRIPLRAAPFATALQAGGRNI